jgi:CheY-like chemotaxis protein
MATPKSAVRPFQLNCLMASFDPTTIREVMGAAAELAISIQEWNGLPEFAATLDQKKFEAIIVDFGIGEDAVRKCIKLVRRSPSNQPAIVFALTNDNGEIASAFTAGANLTLKKPLARDSIISTFKLAYGSMIRERRRYFRCPLSAVASIEQGHGPVHCRALNISEGGMAIVHEHEVQANRRTVVRFQLPGQPSECIAEAVVRWSRAGVAGLHFQSLTAEHNAQLHSWLGRQLEKQLPDSVKAQFGKSG